MVDNLRDRKQEDFVDMWFAPDRRTRGIYLLAPRFGKCAVGIEILRSYVNVWEVVIAYPELSIKESWLSEMNRLGVSPDGVTFCTHVSLGKVLQEPRKHIFRLIIVDEIHLLSDRQMAYLNEENKVRTEIVGLTGTLSYWTEKYLKDVIDMPVIARYPIDEAVKDGFVADYQITVKTAPLDDIVKTKNSKGKLLTEKERFDRISNIIDRLESEGKDTKFLRLNRMRIIQNSVSKIEATKQLLKQFSNDRTLVFSGLKEVAESFGCPFHHSGVKDDEAYDNFKAGKGENHLAVVRIGNSGVTYKPLSKVIINYFDSSEENLVQKINRCMGLEFDNPGKISDIWIVTSGEPVENKWLEKALSALDPRKIKYI